MRYTITGDNLQFVNVQLEEGEKFQSSAGAMKYMSGNMTMEAKMKGGFLKGLKRSLMGESMFLLEYVSHGGSGVVGFGGGAPGKIMDIDVSRSPGTSAPRRPSTWTWRSRRSWAPYSTAGRG